jgi:hypothetical protein
MSASMWATRFCEDLAKNLRWVKTAALDPTDVSMTSLLPAVATGPSAGQNSSQNSTIIAK